MDAIESFPGVDFESSLLQASSEDMNIEDDASTPHPVKEDLKFRGISLSGLSPK